MALSMIRGIVSVLFFLLASDSFYFGSENEIVSFFERVGVGVGDTWVF